MNRRERRRQAKLGAKRSPTGAVDARFQAAQAHQAAGRLAEAEALCRAIIAEHSDHADAHGLLGVVLALQGGNTEAAAALERAIALAPAVAAYHNNLGNVLSSLGQAEQAVDAYGHALALRPDDAPALNNLGTVLKAMGRLADARDAYERALAVRPDYAEAHSNYGNVLLDLGHVGAAAESHRRALAVNPDYAVAHNNLGSALKRKGEYEAAAASFDAAITLMPTYADALSNRGEVLRETGETGAAIDYYRRALDADAARPAIHSNLLYALNCVPEVDRGSVAAEHRRWAQVHTRPATATDTATHYNDPDPKRRLRIGYVSPDFRRHSAGYFIEPVLAAHDPAAVEVFCYASSNLRDEVSERLRALAHGWRDIDALDDGQAAKRIGADGVDILVDLSGHTMNGRLALFAGKPAPVQVTYLGYPNTTGLNAMDYRLTDARADPEGDGEAFHTETLVRLPGGFLCYRPPDDAPAVAPPRDGPITFVSCNNLAKVTPPVVAAWAALLARLPTARLLLKAKALGDARTRRRMAERFADHGVAARRIDMMGWVETGSHLDVYGGADIGLDTFPYNGTTTTCEALWMGVPVVTLAGDRHAGRVGASLLARVGLGDLVASSSAAYVETAQGLANDREALGRLRGRLRAMITDGGLTDGPAFTAALEAAYRRMWEAWCARHNA